MYIFFHSKFLQRPHFSQFFVYFAFPFRGGGRLWANFLHHQTIRQLLQKSPTNCHKMTAALECLVRRSTLLPLPPLGGGGQSLRSFQAFFFDPNTCQNLSVFGIWEFFLNFCLHRRKVPGLAHIQKLCADAIHKNSKTPKSGSLWQVLGSKKIHGQQEFRLCFHHFCLFFGLEPKKFKISQMKQIQRKWLGPYLKPLQCGQMVFLISPSLQGAADFNKAVLPQVGRREVPPPHGSWRGRESGTPQPGPFQGHSLGVLVTIISVLKQKKAHSNLVRWEPFSIFYHKKAEPCLYDSSFVLSISWNNSPEIQLWAVFLIPPPLKMVQVFLHWAI